MIKTFREGNNRFQRALVQLIIHLGYWETKCNTVRGKMNNTFRDRCIIINAYIKNVFSQVNAWILALSTFLNQKVSRYCLCSNREDFNINEIYFQFSVRMLLNQKILTAGEETNKILIMADKMSKPLTSNRAQKREIVVVGEAFFFLYRNWG